MRPLGGVDWEETGGAVSGRCLNSESCLLSKHRGPTQSVCVADCYFTVNVLDLPFASPIAIYC